MHKLGSQSRLYAVPLVDLSKGLDLLHKLLNKIPRFLSLLHREHTEPIQAPRWLYLGRTCDAIRNNLRMGAWDNGE